MALERRLRQLCTPDSPAIQRWRKRVTIERFLARLQASDASPYLLKGAFALYLRFGPRARVTQDLDLGLVASGRHLPAPSPTRIREELQQAAGASLDDFFSYEIAGQGEPIPAEPNARAHRFSVHARLDERPFESFRVDIGTVSKLVAPVEEIPESDTLAFAGIRPSRFRVVPLAQQFAEKVHAYTFPWQDRENTRVKDLIDLVLVLELGPPQAASIRTAVEAIFKERGSHPPPAAIPDPPASWSPVYAGLAAESQLVRSTVTDGVELLRQFWATVFPRRG